MKTLKNIFESIVKGNATGKENIELEVYKGENIYRNSVTYLTIYAVKIISEQEFNNIIEFYKPSNHKNFLKLLRGIIINGYNLYIMPAYDEHNNVRISLIADTEFNDDNEKKFTFFKKIHVKQFNPDYWEQNKWEIIKK